ncbi:MAG: HesA/MoeB/ThiF family protein [Muribaculaceae bacterium]|nr:HesA/MoeB/ThiF family protein [Muribaculaceae bacterium]
MKTKPFTPQESQRYKGHLSLCEIDIEGQRRLRDARVLIVGAGGLGSPVALYLAAAGVGRIDIVDPDTVSLSNLQRQILHGTSDIGYAKVDSARESMQRINPDVKVESIKEFLSWRNGGSIIEGHDLVMDCTDNMEVRLLINDLCTARDIPYIFGAVRRWGGQLFTWKPGFHGYRDIFPPDPDTQPEDLPCAIDGVLNTVVGVIGCLQATEAIKLITGTGDLLTGRLLTFDAITMKFEEFKF